MLGSKLETFPAAAAPAAASAAPMLVGRVSHGFNVFGLPNSNLPVLFEFHQAFFGVGVVFCGFLPIFVVPTLKSVHFPCDLVLCCIALSKITSESTISKQNL